MLTMILMPVVWAWSGQDCVELGRALALAPDTQTREELERGARAAFAEDPSAHAGLDALHEVTINLDITRIADPALARSLYERACGVEGAPAPPPAPPPPDDPTPDGLVPPRPEEAPAPATEPTLSPERAQALYDAQALVRSGRTFTLEPRLNPAWLSGPPPAPQWTVDQGADGLSALEFAQVVGDTRTQQALQRSLDRQRAAGRGLIAGALVCGATSVVLLANEEARAVGGVTTTLSALGLASGLGLVLTVPQQRMAPVSGWYTEAEADAWLGPYNQQLQRELGLLEGGDP